MARKVTLQASASIPADAGKPADTTPQAGHNQPDMARPVYDLDQIKTVGVATIKELHTLEAKTDMTTQKLAWLIMMRHVDMVANDDKPAPLASLPRSGEAWTSYRRACLQFFLGDRVTDGGNSRTADTVRAAAAYTADEAFVDRALKLATDLALLGVEWSAFNQDESQFVVARGVLLETGDMYLDLDKDGNVTVPETVPLDNKQYGIRTGYGSFPAIKASMARINVCAASKRDPSKTPAARRAARQPTAKPGSSATQNAAPTNAPANVADAIATNGQPGIPTGGLPVTFYVEQVTQHLVAMRKLYEVQSVAEMTLDDFPTSVQNDLEDLRRFLNSMIARTSEARKEKAQAELIAKREAAKQNKQAA